MNILLGLILWLMLFAISWPLAFVALIIWPLLWLISLPFRIVGYFFTGLLALVGAIFLLPARLLGWRPKPRPFA